MSKQVKRQIWERIVGYSADGKTIYYEAEFEHVDSTTKIMHNISTSRVTVFAWRDGPLPFQPEKINEKGES